MTGFTLLGRQLIYFRTSAIIRNLPESCIIYICSEFQVKMENISEFLLSHMVNLML